MGRQLADIPVTSEILARFWEHVDKKYFNDVEGVWIRPYGTCTYLNAAPVDFLRKAGHAAQMFGGDESVMAGSGFVIEYDLLGGHDWLLVDARWIIDLWASAYLGVARCVHDIEDAATFGLYPPRESWCMLNTCQRFEHWYQEAAEDWGHVYRLEGLNNVIRHAHGCISGLAHF